MDWNRTFEICYAIAILAIVSALIAHREIVNAIKEAGKAIVGISIKSVKGALTSEN